MRLYREQFAYGRVDGRYASQTADIRVVMGAETYAHAAAQYRGNNDNMDALMSVMARSWWRQGFGACFQR